MKYISFAIPCYNSEAYMEKAINSILVGGEDVEIIVVNDGSKDGTQEIAERYQEKYPTIVKAVAKPNGGHGDAVNCGLEHATGKYFKVVDSDDWVDEEALLKVLDTIKGFVKDESEVDMVIANYVYEKVGMTHKKVIRYDNVIPENQIFKWEDIGHFRLDQYILMHSVIYRTEMLKHLCTVNYRVHQDILIETEMSDVLPFKNLILRNNVIVTDDFLMCHADLLIYIVRNDHIYFRLIFYKSFDRIKDLQQCFLVYPVITVYNLKILSCRMLQSTVHCISVSTVRFRNCFYDRRIFFLISLCDFLSSVF